MAPKRQKPPLDTIFLHKQLKKGLGKKKVQPQASLFLEGVLQYLAAEVLELSYHAAVSRQAGGKKGAVTITTEDIAAAVESDEELKYLVKMEQKKPSKSKAKVSKPKVTVSKSKTKVVTPEGNAP